MDIKLWQGDCLVQMKKIPDKSINLILTDIPYNEVNRKSNGLRNLDKGAADVLTFNLHDFLVQCNRVCSGTIYIFCGTEQVSEIRKTLAQFGLSTRHCVWEKISPSPMNGQYIWLSSIENCIFAKNKGATFNEHCKSSVWRFSSSRNKQHPTEKPIKLFEYLVSTSSNSGDLVLDPCMGGGTSGVACKKLGRRFIGVELDQAYFDAAKQRIDNTQYNNGN